MSWDKAEQASLMQYQAGSMASTRANLKQNFEQQLESAKANVKRLEELVALLNANPDTERILNLMQQGY